METALVTDMQEVDQASNSAIICFHSVFLGCLSVNLNINKIWHLSGVFRLFCIAFYDKMGHRKVYLPNF